MADMGFTDDQHYLFLTYIKGKAYSQVGWGGADCRQVMQGPICPWVLQPHWGPRGYSNTDCSNCSSISSKAWPPMPISSIELSQICVPHGGAEFQSQLVDQLIVYISQPCFKCLSYSNDNWQNYICVFNSHNNCSDIKIIDRIESERKWSREVAQSCPTLYDPVDCSLPGSSVHGILQARILEWVTMSFSRGYFQSRDRIRVFCIGGRRFNLWATREAPWREYAYRFIKIGLA